MKVDRINIRGYKSICRAEVKLNNLNVLIGANGAGKSNFVAFFKMLNEIYNNNLQVYTAKSGGAASLLYFGRKHTQTLQTDIHFGENSYHFSLEPTDEDQFVFKSERVCYHNPKYEVPFEQILGSGHKETELFRISKSTNRRVVVDYVIGALKDWKVYHFHDTSPSAGIKQSGPIDDNDVLRPDASNLAAFLYMLKKTAPSSYERILSTVQLVAPFIKDFLLEPMKLNNNLVRLRWIHKEDADSVFDTSQLSDGTLRTICLVTLLLQPDPPATIIIDEPELGLHPYAITLLGSLIKSVSSHQQIILSTQSVSLIDNFEPEDIIVVDYYEKQSHFKRLNSNELNEWLSEYSLGELWVKNVLGGRPRW